MNLVVLSGKGGTGKTTISVNLASIAGQETALLDCDVDEPNSHLFIDMEFNSKNKVEALYPTISEKDCIHCGKCGTFCKFNAILCTRKMNIIMPELCHDCGGCAIVCPVNAITFGSRSIGQVRKGTFKGKQLFIDGLLNTGEFSGTNIIKRVLEEGLDKNHRIIDAPPGSACAAVETAASADLALIVTEPTPFALSDMKMVVEMLENLKIPTAVFINKSGTNETDVIKYCHSKNLPIIGKLPFLKKYGKAYAEGKILTEEFPAVKKTFEKLWENITNEY